MPIARRYTENNSVIFEDWRLGFLFPFSFFPHENGMDSSYFSTKLNSGYFLRPCSKLKSSVVYTACLLKFLWEYGFWRVLIRILSFPASEHFEVTSNSVWEHEHLLDAFFAAFPILFSPSRTFPLHGLICRKFCANNWWTSNRWIELIRGYGWRKNWKIKREISLQFCCLKCLWLDQSEEGARGPLRRNVLKIQASDSWKREKKAAAR